MAGFSTDVARGGKAVSGYATRIDIAGTDPQGKSNRDVMWSLSFEPTIDNITALLFNPVQFVVESCSKLGVTSAWFVSEQPITIQFNYFADSRKNSANIDQSFLAQGMFGSNVIFVKCSFVEQIDFKKIDPFVDLDGYIGELLGVGIYQRFRPKIHVVYNGAFKQYTVHYELIDTEEMPSGGKREDVILKVTSSFINNPNIIPLCLNNCSEYALFGFNNNENRLSAINRSLKFTIGSSVGDVLSSNGFAFTYQTAPIGVDTSSNESEDSGSAFVSIPSDCVTFVAGCNPEDPMAGAGILIAELESGCQLRWLPQSSPEPVAMIGTEVVTSNGMQATNEEPG